MQVRYVFDPELLQARGRLALGLIPVLAQALQEAQGALKAEPAGGKAGEGWKPLYPQMAQPMLQPRVQIFQGPAGLFQAHPLQWNVVLDPVTVPPGADEVWVFSEARATALASDAAPAPGIKVLPPAIGELSPEMLQGALPMELNEPKVLFCSLPWGHQDRLRAALRAYVPAFAGQSEVTLALHLDSPEQDTGIEESLMGMLEGISAETGADLEALNLETLIGPLDAAGYLALLQKCLVLVAPSDGLQALEALSLGKAVVGSPDSRYGEIELSPESLQQALEKAPAQASETPKAEDAQAELAAAIVTELKRIEQSVDFAAKAAAWKQSQEHARQGRKQKYSLFHSDYQEPEMQARRQWHLRYAQMLAGVPGDVLDIGSGSGIFLEIMRDLGMPACGIDPDADMVDVCRELGLQALPGDDRLLAEWQPESLGGIHASHVIEHIDGSRAISLIENAFAALRPGGKFLVRTPNWRNDTVRHEGFWLDITHIRPYPLPLLKQVFEDAGFVVDQMGFEEFGWNDTFIVGRKPGGLHG